MYIESYSNKKIKHLKEMIQQIPSVYLRSPVQSSCCVQTMCFKTKILHHTNKCIC